MREPVELVVENAEGAVNIPLQNGFKVRNISGGLLSRAHSTTFWEG